MPAVLLPKIIETKFEDLARQVRRLRLYRGVSRLLLVGLVLAAVAIVLDARFQFGTNLRYGLLIGWFGLLLVAAWRLILRPIREPLTTTTLAAAIETEFPSLSERLMTVVELSESGDAGHGSKSLMDLLVRDTTNRTRKLKVDRAAPRGPVFRLMAAAVAILLVGLLTAMFVTGGTDSVKRFLLPWHTPKIDVPFTVKVSSGSPVVKRGDSVTLTGFLERKNPDAVLPATASLLTKDSAGVEKKFPMIADAANAAFHLSRPTVGQSFEYRIEAGAAVSEWFTVTVADAVDLADGTMMTLTPPEYAVPPLAVQSTKGFSEIETLQYSQVTFDFRFNRPAVAAAFEWVATAAGPVIDRERITLSIEADRLSAKATVPLHTSGSYHLVLTGEHGLTTNITVSAKAIADAPPKFDKATGISDRAKEIRPDEKIILETAVSDDFKVVTLELEYTVNDGPPITVPMTAKDLGTPKAESKFIFDLNGKVKEGESLKYRLKATDNRAVPSASLKPQVTYFPEKTWSSVKISLSAESLDQQEILGQRNAIKAKLEEAAKAVTDARRETDRVKREANDKPLTPEQKARLEKAREETGKATEVLDAAAKEAGLTPELRALEEATKDTANDNLKPAEETIRKAEHESDAKARDKDLKKAEEQLTEAADAVAKLQKLNDDLARNRLDKRRLEKLSDEVNRLGDAAKNADAAKKDETLKKLQQAKDELRDVIQGNETLRTAAEKATGNEANNLAKDAKKLAEDQKKLDAEIAAGGAGARKKAQDANARAQDDLNKQADAVREAAGKTKTGDGLPKEPFDKAAEQLKDGNAVDAMTAQEKAARELDKLAADLKKAAGERRDPKQAATELAKLQDELQKRRAEAAKQSLTPEQKHAFDKEQDELRKAAANVSTPPGDASTAKEKADAVEKMKEAQQAANPEPAQQEAAEALRRLAEKMPSREQRLKETAKALDAIQKEQDALQREIDEASKGSDRRKPDEALQKELAGKLDAAAKKQAEIGEKLSKLDTPGLDQRKNRTAEAAKNAGEDLQKGLPQDIPASQAELKKKLNQLRTAVDGGVPNDAVADELAKQQNKLADRLQQQQPDAAALQEMNKLQREFADKLGTMKEPDGAERLNRAKQSAEAAAEQFKKADDLDELRKKTKQAAKDLDDLADHLAGAESDADRAQRIAKQRQERAEWSKQNAGKPVPPDQAAAMQSELEREIDDLKKTRAGAAQAEKKAAADALEKLKKTPNAERAQGLQKDAAEALDQLAKKMQPAEPVAKQPRNTGEKDPVGDAGGKLPTQEQADAAKDLAGKQRDLRDQTAKANAEAGKNADAKATEGQSQKQDGLAKEADKLAKKLDQASNAPGNTPETIDADALSKAADSAKAAQEKMEKAAREQKAGQGKSAAEARADAAKSLEQAAKQAGDAVKDGGKNGQPDPNAVAASESADAANKMLKDAGPGVGKNDPGAAKQLKDAADKIGDAADKLGEVGKNPKQESKPGKPGGDKTGDNDGSKGKALTAEDLPADLKQYAGKLWGDLPGDVKTKIVQDLKAKYGEDYARVIKLYFEQQAEKK